MGQGSEQSDGESPTSPVLSDGFASYTPGLSEKRGGTSRFVGSDYLGTHSKMLDSAGAVASSRQYDAFGVRTSGSDPSPFGFAGSWGYQEDAGGLKLLGHRYYDPSTGRFLTRDPIKDGRNWYAYCGNNPTAAVDPTGLSPHGAVIVGALMVIFAIIDAAMSVEAVVREPSNPANYVGFVPIPYAGPVKVIGKKLLKLRALGPEAVEAAAPATRKLTKGEQLAVNRESGLAAEERVLAELESIGYRVDRKKVAVETPFGRRIHDGRLLDPGGEFIAWLEIKSGAAKFKSKQRQKDAWINDQRGQPTIELRDPLGW